MDAVEDFLVDKKFEKLLKDTISKVIRGQGASSISIDMCVKIVCELRKHMPPALQDVLPEPDREFLLTAVADLERRRSDSFMLDDIEKIVQIVFIRLAASVDALHEMMRSKLGTTSVLPEMKL